MIKPEGRDRIILGHTLWSNEASKDEWRPIREALKGNYWMGGKASSRSWEVRGDAVTGLSGDESRNGDVYPTQTNMISPFVNGFIASLYYNGIRVVVKASDFPEGTKDKEAKSKEVVAIRNTLNSFLQSSAIDDVSERLFGMGLVYRGGCAYKLRQLEPLKGQTARDLMCVEAIPPWECVWDRKTRSAADQRFRGHLRQVPMDRAKATWAKLTDEHKPEPLVDVPADGFNLRTHSEHEPIVLDEAYFWILTFDDWTGVKDVDGVGVRGVRHEFLVTDISAAPKLTELKSGPTPYAWKDGSPASELIEFIPDPILERPMDSRAVAKDVYELNAEFNNAQSILAGAFRRDAGRVLLTEDGSAEEGAKVARARDLEVIKVKKGRTPLDKRYVAVEWGQISGTLREYVDMVREGIDRTQLTADFTRGKAGNYLSATEVANLVEYTTATIGRFRKRSDLSIVKLCEFYLLALATAMEDMEEKSFDIEVEGEIVKVTPDMLRQGWSINVVDTASTPGATAQKLADFQAGMGPMMELAGTIDPPAAEGQPSNMQKNLAMTSMRLLAELLRLPADFDPNTLLKAPPPEVSTPQPEPEPAVSPLPADGAAEPLPPEAMANTPVAQAIQQQAEEEQIVG